MFTGLIEDIGLILKLDRGSERVRIKIGTRIPMKELSLGESIAVNGICLTVVAFGEGAFSADVSPETLERSTLGELAPGAKVNLERALRLSDRLGGHLVSGHIDGIAVVKRRWNEGNAEMFSFSLPKAIHRYLVEKGSVAVDGVSLTVNTITEDGFELAVIPHSLEMTTLKDRQSGSKVNIETDLIGKYVERYLRAGGARDDEKSLDIGFLAKHGFL